MNRSSAHPNALNSWQRIVFSPLFLFTGFGIIVLAGIWTLTLSFILSERDAAIYSARVSSHQQADTYEAHVVRALREIDQTLLFLQYAHSHGRDNYLADLEERSLLPPALLFIVSIADEQGNIVYSNRPRGLSNVAEEEYFVQQKEADLLTVSKPQRLEDEGPFYVHFSRRLSSAENEFNGIAIVSVETDYFVSSYESNILGAKGLLAMLDKDGVFIASRSGETISTGEVTDYSEIRFHNAGEVDVANNLMVNPWDGVQRYTSALELFQFPIAVVVGLSAEEQLADYFVNRDRDLLLAGVGSVAVVIVLTLLGFQSHQLVKARRRALEIERANLMRAEKLALHDALTGLPNRILFSQLVDQSLHRARRNKHRLAIIFLDLDHFKNINDTLGHDAGDELLKETAKRLRACFRKSDTIARFGGDEFVALMPEINTAADAGQVAQKIVDTIAEPFFLNSKACYVSASVGIAIFPEDGEDEETLAKKADSAMYISKKDGRNTYRFSTETA
tara:strand:+ start:21449 stop:22966 length:1518 start_codon:yes stop_codon:yes gene_type:complete